jgi:hypothetical protein
MSSGRHAAAENGLFTVTFRTTRRMTTSKNMAVEGLMMIIDVAER